MSFSKVVIGALAAVVAPLAQAVVVLPPPTSFTLNINGQELALNESNAAGAQNTPLGKGWAVWLTQDIALGSSLVDEYGEDTGFTLQRGQLGADGYPAEGTWFYWDEDPVLSYSFSAIDTGASSVMSYSITAAMNPSWFGPTVLTTSFGGFMADGAGDANSTVGITALPPAGGVVDTDGITELQVTTFHRQVPNDWRTFRHDLGLGTSGSVIVGLGPYAEADFFNPTFANRWDSWRHELNFLGTGGDDVYSFVGRAEIAAPVPVPAAIWFLVSGLAGMGMIRRRGTAQA